MPTDIEQVNSQVVAVDPVVAKHIAAEMQTGHEFVVKFDLAGELLGQQGLDIAGRTGDLGSEQTLSALTVEDVRSFHTRLMRPGASTLIAVGDLWMDADWCVAADAPGLSIAWNKAPLLT